MVGDVGPCSFILPVINEFFATDASSVEVGVLRKRIISLPALYFQAEIDVGVWFVVDFNSIDIFQNTQMSEFLVSLRNEIHIISWDEVWSQKSAWCAFEYVILRPVTEHQSSSLIVGNEEHRHIKAQTFGIPAYHLKLQVNWLACV